MCFFTVDSSGQCVGVGSNFNDDVSSFGPDKGLTCTVYRFVPFTRNCDLALTKSSKLVTLDALAVLLAGLSTLVSSL